ncbi:MAG TPA: glycosyltransferase, partial [Planctomycetota bacterium]|nr:glycosyltransferase [Planctomycetota bacterium]
HEIASRGYGKGIIQGPQALRESLHRTREALEASGSNRVYGYRHWRWITHPDELWILQVAAGVGHAYSSSVNPLLRRFAHDSRWLEPHCREFPPSGRPLWEFPVSTTNVLGHRLPISGGNYLRQLPHRMMSAAIARLDRTRQAPILFYFFPWEIDCSQPQIRGVSFLQQMRHYRRIGKTRHIFSKYFKRYSFQPIGDHLGLPWRTAPVEPRASRPLAEIISADPEPSPGALDVSVVVPLYNEESNVPFLHGNLLDLRRRLARHYRVQFILVNDGSSDGTRARLEERFAGFPGCRILHHEKNAGVAAAILTGIRNATTEFVASMDCDCSYDPNDLEAMIPLIENADLVTASPYHPDGAVFNVPRWRLFLSRTLSWMYSGILKSTIHTYTSCFRVYRKSAVEQLPVRQGGFLGIAEMLIRLRLAGGRITEYPTTLESRLFGESKMKILRTITRHLGLLFELITTPRSPEAPGSLPGRPESARPGSAGPLPPSAAAPVVPPSSSASAPISSGTSPVKLP